MYKPSYRHTCINASVSVHTQSVIRTKVTDLVYEKKSEFSTLKPQECGECLLLTG